MTILNVLTRRSTKAAWLSLCLIQSLCLTQSPVLAQRELKDIPVPDPEVEKSTFVVDDGWKAELFAGDPAMAKPIHMNFDNHGRLWIASSETYPQIKPGEPSNDKILILEDSDKDGKTDRTIVFADGLLIPTGVLPANDSDTASAYVVNSDQLLYLRDTDGDLVADEKKVVLAGFGTEDTHHLLHSLRWGHDGWIYMNQSIYIHSHIETPWGVERLNGGGIWRFHPETKRLEIVVRGFVNPWGVHFDRYGQMFATDGAYGEGINYTFEGSVFVTAVGAKRILSGLNPGSPKHCGLEILSGNHWPESIRGSMVTNDFRAHRVCRFKVSEDRSGYESVQQAELIKTPHVAFRPIDAKQGLDGALYIADWYNPIIQHGEVDFRDPRRDRTHGRIWRLTHKDQKPVENQPITAKDPIEKNLQRLGDDADLVRLFAGQALRRQVRTSGQAKSPSEGTNPISRRTAQGRLHPPNRQPNSMGQNQPIRIARSFSNRTMDRPWKESCPGRASSRKARSDSIALATSKRRVGTSRMLGAAQADGSILGFCTLADDARSFQRLASGVPIRQVPLWK